MPYQYSNEEVLRLQTDAIIGVLKKYGVRSANELAERLDAFGSDHMKVFRVEISRAVRFKMCVHATNRENALDIAKDILRGNRNGTFEDGTYEIQYADGIREPDVSEVKFNDRENAE